MDSARRTFVGLLFLFCLHFVFPNNQVRADSASCEQIKTACKNAGFILGGGARDGLLLDCLNPIVQGIAQPKAASRPDCSKTSLSRAGASASETRNWIP